ncbi:MAG: cytochrome P450 [Baekduia sp.]
MSTAAVIPAPPPPPPLTPAARIRWDLAHEREATVPYPPGPSDFSVRRLNAFNRDPLGMALDYYERYGPVVSVRLFHLKSIWMIGPEANRHILLENPKNFLWRDGSFADLIPLLGDGMLTIDGAFHRTSRMALVPAFTKGRIAKAKELIDAEVAAAVGALRPGDRFDLAHWTRELALRVAIKALLGFDSDAGERGRQAARDFEVALGFYGVHPLAQVPHGPGTPWRRMRAAAGRLDRLIYGELSERRARAAGSDDGHGDDLLGLLLDLQAAGGIELEDSHLRDQVMTLMFAGHDTTTATVSFLFYELARNPELAGDPGFVLDHAIDETLRMYPPAWIGPRRSVDPFHCCGHTLPGRAAIAHSSWITHHLPDVWDEPSEFRPDRFAPGNVEQIEKGAYIPFGGGSRTCLGMRFGQAEIRSIGEQMLERFRLDLEPGYELSIHTSPTLGPRGGLPVRVRAARG